MRYIIFSIIMLVGVFAHSTSAQSKSAPNPPVDKFTVKVDGLGCPYCAFGLEKKFKELKGIHDIKIQMKTGVLTFAYPSEEKLSEEAVAKQVDKAGYTAVKVEVERAGEPQKAE